MKPQINLAENKPYLITYKKDTNLCNRLAFESNHEMFIYKGSNFTIFTKVIILILVLIFLYNVTKIPNDSCVEITLYY